MKWNIFPAADFDRYRETWEKLNASGLTSPLLSPAFVGPLLSYFGSGEERLAVCEGPQGPLSLALMTPRRRDAWVTFQSLGPIGIFSAAPGIKLDVLLRGLLEVLPGYPFAIGVTQQDPDLLPRPPTSGRVATLDSIHAVSITVRGSFEDYWAARGKNLKRTIENQTQRLRGEGIETHLEVLTDANQVARGIADYGRLEFTGRKPRAGAVIHPNSSHGWFYRTVLEEFCRQGTGRIYCYRFDKKVVAMALCVEGNGSLIFLDTSYDESLERFSPALLMREEAFRHIFDEGRIKAIKYYGTWLESEAAWGGEAGTLYDLHYYRWPLLAKTPKQRQASTRPPHSSADARNGKLVHAGPPGRSEPPGGVGLAASRLWRHVGRLAQTMRQLGALDGCLSAIDQVIAAISFGRARLHKYYFVAQPIPSKRWLSPKRGASLEIRRVLESDPVVKEFPRPDWAVPYRFKQGAICLAEFKENRCIGFMWLTLGPYQEDEVRCRYIPLPEGAAAWDFDVYLEPEHRNGIAFLKLWDEANGFLASRQIRWSLSRISAFNTVSISAHGRMGAKRIGTVTFLSIGPHQIAAATVPPYFHFSTRTDSFPVFALDPEPARRNETAR